MEIVLLFVLLTKHVCVAVRSSRERKRHGRNRESSVAQGGGGEGSYAVLHRGLTAGWWVGERLGGRQVSVDVCVCAVCLF